jgi:uncharacterized protein YbaR (Trm112 family)
MKPWLLNVLACPIDKHHPLETYFFKWETANDELEKINRDAGKPQRVFLQQYRHLAKQIADKTISPNSIKIIIDKSENPFTFQLLADVKMFCRKLEFEIFSEKKLLEEYIEGMDVLYRYLNLIEVDEGLLFCPSCYRWYPIGSSVATIPELMPDGLREKEKDLKWLGKWKKLVPGKILEYGKPFTFQ